MIFRLINTINPKDIEPNEATDCVNTDVVNGYIQKTDLSTIEQVPNSINIGTTTISINQSTNMLKDNNGNYIGFYTRPDWGNITTSLADSCQIGCNSTNPLDCFNITFTIENPSSSPETWFNGQDSWSFYGVIFDNGNESNPFHLGDYTIPDNSGLKISSITVNLATDECVAWLIAKNNSNGMMYIIADFTNNNHPNVNDYFFVEFVSEYQQQTFNGSYVFVYTYINEYGESPPSVPKTFSIFTNKNFKFTLGGLPAETTGFRVYVLINDAYYLVGESNSTELCITANSIKPSLNILLTGSDMILPKKLEYIATTTKTIAVSTTDNELFISKINNYGEFPFTKYIQFDSNIVGIATLNSNYIVITSKSVYRVDDEGVLKKISEAGGDEGSVMAIADIVIFSNQTNGTFITNGFSVKRVFDEYIGQAVGIAQKRYAVFQNYVYDSFVGGFMRRDDTIDGWLWQSKEFVANPIRPIYTRKFVVEHEGEITIEKYTDGYKVWSTTVSSDEKKISVVKLSPESGWYHQYKFIGSSDAKLYGFYVEYAEK